jgi:CheY-like chemotaxis protein
VIVAAVSNGLDLVEAAARLGPDVVVSDVHLPLLSGTEALMNVQEAGIDIPFVFVCSDRVPVDRVR